MPATEQRKIGEVFNILLCKAVESKKAVLIVGKVFGVSRRSLYNYRKKFLSHRRAKRN